MSSDVLEKICQRWGEQRAEEAKTMCLDRKPTKEEIDRAMIIGKWFWTWNNETGVCPIDCMTPHWGKKLCALFEWIAMLESDNLHKTTQPKGPHDNAD